MKKNIAEKFSCVSGCSDCCVNRAYYPSEKFGKIGVLLLPGEVREIEEMARKLGVKVKILPRIAIGSQLPEKVIAFQMMGKNEDGDLCPFLDTSSGAQSPHGGFPCRIYEDRPAACRAYPVLEIKDDVVTLDEHCKFCRENSTSTASVNTIGAEIKALEKIKGAMNCAGSQRVWRYATATGRREDREKMLSEGWVIER